MDAKDYPAACPKFAESQKLEPAPGTLLNLADCYEKSGQTTSAWATFKEAAKSAASRNRADWVATANARANALAPKLASLAINIGGPADVAGLRVERDGVVVERDAWGTAVPLDPILDVLAATATGRKAWTKRVDVPPAKNIVVDVPVLESDASSAPAIREEARERGAAVPSSRTASRCASRATSPWGSASSGSASARSRESRRSGSAPMPRASATIRAAARPTPRPRTTMRRACDHLDDSAHRGRRSPRRRPRARAGSAAEGRHARGDSLRAGRDVPEKGDSVRSSASGASCSASRAARWPRTGSSRR